MNTRLTYEYRDGGCNRFFTDVVLAGEMTDRRWTRIRGICNDGDQFIAHQVGLREVFSFLPGDHILPFECRETGYPYHESIDHCWHHFAPPNAWELTGEPPRVAVSVTELVALFEVAARSGWQVFDPAERFGL